MRARGPSYIRGLDHDVPLPVSADFWAGYSQFARYMSILFLIAQVLIIVDAAYTVHEALLARMDARDAALDAQGWEPGLCSNGWKVLYVLLAAFCVSGWVGFEFVVWCAAAGVDTAAAEMLFGSSPSLLRRWQLVSRP